MTNQNDPISEIKKAELATTQKIDQTKKDQEDELRKYEEELEESVSTFESNLKEKGMEKLNTVKQEASEIFKSKMATSESEKNKIISEAETKEQEAKQEIISYFLSYVKV
jgi:vacuolar-type H+-ATPase subunit H